MNISFNKPYFTGKEINNIAQAISSGKVAGDGLFTKKCHRFFEERYNFKKCFLTTSCTDALEMTAILSDISEGDEVIMPSYTFVSTANAFVLRGAKIIFADSTANSPNIDADRIEVLITKKTRAIVIVHYAGIACNMRKISEIVSKYGLILIEDAAHSVDSFYENRPLGSFGHLATFSFHETKNIICGEGGMLVINDEKYIRRAEIIREKGTNRTAFFRGEIDKYEWIDIGSSFLPSEITAAFLCAQLEELENIQIERKKIWNTYHKGLFLLEEKGLIKLPEIPAYASNNAHIFYLICRSAGERTKLIRYLADKDIHAVFHYSSLHRSFYFKNYHDGRDLLNSDTYAERLLRIPLYFELKENEIFKIISSINNFYNR